MASLMKSLAALAIVFSMMNSGQVTTSAHSNERVSKEVHGNPSEGRSLVLEMNGWALTNAVDILIATNATTAHDDSRQHFVLNRNGTRFVITSAMDNYTVNDANSYMQKPGVLPSTFNITDLGRGLGYSIQLSNGRYFSISMPGRVTIGGFPLGFNIYTASCE